MGKKVKLCGNNDYNHDWVEVGKCKDALGRHPCKYHPEGCNTCLTRFECYTKDNDTYRTRLTGIFYACKNCPAVKVVGQTSYWETREWNDVLDIREKFFYGMDKALIDKLSKRWQDNGNKKK